MMHRRFDPTIPPSLKITLDDDKEVDVFRGFQASSVINQVLPGSDMRTEYDKETSTWKLSSAVYIDNFLRSGSDPNQEQTTGSTPSWDGVLKLIQDAEAQYKSKGDKSRFRRFLRQGQDVSVVLNGLVELIPDEYGLGILRAGLSMLFTVRTFLLLTQFLLS